MTDQEKIESLREIMSDFEPTKDPEKKAPQKAYQ